MCIRDSPYTHAPDPTQDFDPLPEHAEFQTAPKAGIGEGSPADEDNDRPPRSQESASDITRTAISVQARGGVLYIFMPPTDRLEDYLEPVSYTHLDVYKRQRYRTFLFRSLPCRFMLPSIT